MRIHFIAIGGAAMHNLAMAVASKRGYVVSGSDDEIFDPAQTHLREAGLLPNQLGWFPEKITPDLDAVILGMHAWEDNPELLRARELGIKIYSFPEYLYEQTKDKVRIVVGGSHGKTTTTSMILFVLKQLGIEADYMVGAQIEGFERMVRLSDTARLAVFEGDEYLTSPLDQRSKFLWYHPHVAILTGIAWDHVNVFPTFDLYTDTFRRFVETIESYIPPVGLSVTPSLIYYAKDENLQSVAHRATQGVQVLPYEEMATLTCHDVPCVRVNRQGEETLLPLGVFGKHNLQNMQAAYLACRQVGVSSEDFLQAIVHFRGAANRLEQIAQSDDGTSVCYRDFAHSPSKLKATLDAVRERYPHHYLIACMELHTFSSLMADFLPQYVGSMDKADKAMVYYNPKVVEQKRLESFGKEDVLRAFGRRDLEVFTDKGEFEKILLKEKGSNRVLLMMSSGTFGGIDMKELSRHVLLNA